MILKRTIQATENTERDEALPSSVTHSKSESKFHESPFVFRARKKHAAHFCIDNLSVNSVFSVANLGFR